MRPSPSLLLIHASDTEYAVLQRYASHYNPSRRYNLARGGQKHYHQQYADIYFLRLAKLKPAVEIMAEEAWKGFEVKHSLSRRWAGDVDLRMLDSRRNSASCRSRARRSAGRAVLGRRYSIYGHASETQYSR